MDYGHIALLAENHYKLQTIRHVTINFNQTVALLGPEDWRTGQATNIFTYGSIMESEVGAAMYCADYFTR